MNILEKLSYLGLILLVSGGIVTSLFGTNGEKGIFTMLSGMFILWVIDINMHR